MSVKGDGHSSHGLCRRSYVPVAALLFVSVVAPLIFLTGRVHDFGPPAGHLDFIDEPSSNLNFVSDSRKLNALQQEAVLSRKEPVGVVYKEEAGSQQSKLNQEAEFVEPKSNQQAENVEQATGKRILEQESSGIISEESSGMRNLNGQSTVQEKDKNGLELPGINKPQEIGSGVSPPRNTEGSNKPIPDFLVRQMRDQLIRARVYMNLSPIRNNAHYIRELRVRMKEVQRTVGEATKDSDLPRSASVRMKSMEQTLTRGKQLYHDCSTVVKKLRAMIHSSEEQLRAQRRQNTFLIQLAAKTMPKGLHCFPMRLSTEYYALNTSEQAFPNEKKLEDNHFYHYAIFSDNVFATAVVVNSTVSNAKQPEKHVFHVVTDRLNYAAMRMWFLANPPKEATIEVRNVDDFKWLNTGYSPVLRQLGSPSMKEYYFRSHRGNSDPNLKYRNPKYLSILNHLRFYLPEVFPKLDRVLFLDDDVVVQKDLTMLWRVDMKGKINGAVETCGESFHRFDKYLNFSHPLIAKKFNPNACGWAYGMNMFDLKEWKKQEITGIYHKWQKLNKDRQLWKLGTLPPGLITFYNLTHALDKSWHALGLGYNPNVPSTTIERAAVIHYNGNMKPWLEIALGKYKRYWTKYVKYDHPFLQSCNINE